MHVMSPTMKPKLGSHRPATPRKSTRVRTGCAACRKRKVKCDEAFPQCLNCSKRGDECNRKLTVKFNYTVIFRAPRIVAYRPGCTFLFEDESRKTAKYYVGGIDRYDQLVSEPSSPNKNQPDVGLQPPSPNSSQTDRHLTPEHYTLEMFDVRAFSRCFKGPNRNRLCLRSKKAGDNSKSKAKSCGSPALQSVKPILDEHTSLERFVRDQSCDEEMPPLKPKPHVSQAVDKGTVGRRAFEMEVVSGRQQMFSSLIVPHSKNTAPSRWAEEVFYLGVCLEEIGIWMDCVNNSADLLRHLSRQTQIATAIVNTLLACGVMTLSIASSARGPIANFGPKAAVAWLVRCLAVYDRHSSSVSTTGVLLSVNCRARENASPNMKHVSSFIPAVDAGGWRSKDLGDSVAHFQLRIPTESLTSLIQGCGIIDQTDWTYIPWIGKGFESAEQLWSRRILFILATISNFRASIPRLRNPDRLAEHLRLNKERLKWIELKQLCDEWDDRCPVSMFPSYYSDDSEQGQSLFPIILATILGRLFYHTAQCILIQSYNMRSARELQDMYMLQTHHARQICGLVAQTNDVEIAPVAIQSLTTTAPVLKQRSEQEEVLRMLDGISARSGWHVEGTKRDLIEAWGWKLDDDSNGFCPDESPSISLALENLTPVTELGAGDAALGAWELDLNCAELCIDPPGTTEAADEAMEPSLWGFHGFDSTLFCGAE